MRYNRNFPLALRYNDPSLLGLGLYNPYWEQGFAHIEIVLTHGGCNTITGQLIDATIEQHLLAVGRITPLFSLPYDKLHHLTSPSWITCVWQFIGKQNIQLEFKDTPSMRYLRENDTTIMEALKDTCNMSSHDEIAVNRVRCYLQVITIADIGTGCGKYIHHTYLQAKKVTESSYEWHEEQLCPQDFKLWNKFIPTLLDNTDRLSCPVGSWLAKPYYYWHWHCCGTTDRVFQ